MAMLRGILRGRRNRPPAPATRLRFTSGMPKTAVSEATTRSQASTISVPPASAGPSTAAITGLVRSRCTNPAKPPFWVIMPAGSTLICLRSAPAQKIQPFSVWAPVMMPTQASGSSSRRSMPASMPWATSVLTALRAVGRLMVRTATWPCSS